MENETEKSMIGVREEDENEEEKQKQELEEIISTVPYTLSVALIKITILNNYEPLEIEKYYQKVLPAFHLLRKNDGSRYLSTSISTVRSAMVSNALFSKNEDGLYALHIPNALKIVRILKNKKKSDDPSNNIEFEKVTQPASEKENYNSNINNIMSIYKGLKAKNDNDNMVGKKRKLRKIKKTSEGTKKGIEKFERAFNQLKNLLKVSANDKALYSQLNFDFSEMKDSTQLNVDKIIGMLKVFKFFRPFLEKCFNSIEIQENIMSKISEINSLIYHMDCLFKFND